MFTNISIRKSWKKSVCGFLELVQSICLFETEKKPTLISINTCIVAQGKTVLCTDFVFHQEMAVLTFISFYVDVLMITNCGLSILKLGSLIKHTPNKDSMKRHQYNACSNYSIYASSLYYYIPWNVQPCKMKRGINGFPSSILMAHKSHLSSKAGMLCLINSQNNHYYHIMTLYAYICLNTRYITQECQIHKEFSPCPLFCLYPLSGRAE